MHQNRFTRPHFARGSSASCETQSCALVRICARLSSNMNRTALELSSDGILQALKPTRRRETKIDLFSRVSPGGLTNAMEEGRRRLGEGGRLVNGQKSIPRRNRESRILSLFEFRRIYLCLDYLSQFAYCYTRCDSDAFELEIYPKWFCWKI